MADVTDGTFDSKVLKVSQTTPVLVDFWAPWCNPCLSLSPILDKLEKHYRGKFRLAKLNVDSNPKMSGKFGIRGIPAVKLFKDSKVVAEFVGFKAEDDLRNWLDRSL